MTVIVFVYDTPLIGEFTLFLAKIRYCQKNTCIFTPNDEKAPVTLSPQGPQTS